MTANRIVLGGCAPEPLIHYLKALGVLRLVGEQLDPGATGAWSANGFVLTTSASPAELESFFLDTYSPTPIVAPWNGGSGFWPSTSSEGLDVIAASVDERFSVYRATIAAARALVAPLPEAPKDESKQSLLRACRNSLPDRAVAWLDAAYVLGEEKPEYPPLLGTGGNDGRLDFTNNFAARLGLIIPALAAGRATHRTRALSEQQLHASLFGGSTELLKAAAGQFYPAGAGGANASQGLAGDSFVNPWDFVLAIEGTLAFASATVRQLAAGARSKASFPFTVQNSFVGYGSAADGEKVRAEIWLPIWSRPASAAEVGYLFGEGRARHASIAGKTVRTGFDFVRAVAGLGVDRGIDAFSRFGFLERNGQAYLAVSLGRIEVKERPEASLVSEADRWIEGLRRATRDSSKTPPRLVRARRDVEEAIFALCAHGGRERLLAVLIALGAAEFEVARGPRFRAEHPELPPLGNLSEQWVEACDDGSPEFEIATALASIGWRGDSAPLRQNIEPIKTDAWRRAEWSKDELARVWGAGSLADNLTGVLHRRALDASKAERSHPDLFARHAASLDAIAAFLSNETDDERIEALLRGLTLIAWKRSSPETRRSARGSTTIARAYALLKLVFLPDGHPPRRRTVDGIDDDAMRVAYEPSIVPLLKAGRVDEALQIGARRLRVSGLKPTTEQLYWDRDHAVRLAASLLIPISRSSAETLARLVLHDETEENRS